LTLFIPVPSGSFCRHVKRFLFISSGLFLLLFAGYWLFISTNKLPIKTWDLVLPEAIVVHDHRPGTVDNTAFWIHQLFPDSLSDQIRDERYLLSIHDVGNPKPDIMLYWQQTEKQKKLLATLKPSLKERMFEGHKIYEGILSNKKEVALTLFNDQLVLSSTPILIEDVIRISRSDVMRGFTSTQKELFSLDDKDQSNGGTYYNFSNATRLLGTDYAPSILNLFARSAFTMAVKEKNDVLLTGLVLDSTTAGESFLSMLKHQRPTATALPGYISNRAGALVYFGISDWTSWNEDRHHYVENIHSAIKDSLIAPARLNGFSHEVFFNALGNEIGLCQRGLLSGKVCIANVKDADHAGKELIKLVGERPAETYSSYSIRSFREPGALRSLFYPIVESKMNYFTQLGNYFIFSETIDDVKIFLDDIDNENTWGKSSPWNGLLSSLQDSNAGVILNLKYFGATERNRWQQLLDADIGQSAEKISVQLGRVERKFILEGIIEFDSGLEKADATGFKRNIEVTLATQVHKGPVVVKNHNTGADEVIIQESNGNVQLFSSDLQKIFLTPVDGLIKTDIFQIDFLKNKKLQYLFATNNTLCLLDRLGRWVKGFPVKAGQKKPIEFLSIIDFDNAKKYKFMTSDASHGERCNENGVWKNVSWNCVTDEELWVAPRAIKADGNNRLVSITKQGKLCVTDQSGEIIPGFPFDLPERPSGDWILDKTNGKDLITLVSPSGAMMQIDFEGKMVNRIDLVRGSKDSRFFLIPSGLLNHYIIGRFDENTVTVLNATGEAVFDMPNPGSKEERLDFFESETGKKIFAVTDPEQEFSYFYDEGGKLLFPEPLESQKKPAVIWGSGNEVYIYTTNKNRLRRFVLALENNH
jgi:hypothetical protein